MSLIIILIALNISITIIGLLLWWKMGAKMMQAAFHAFWHASKCSWNILAQVVWPHVRVAVAMWIHR